MECKQGNEGELHVVVRYMLQMAKCGGLRRAV